MKVGVPCEIKQQEYRVGLTPDAVREYTAAGHAVLVERNAGEAIGAADEHYVLAGATIAESAAEVFATARAVQRSRMTVSESRFLMPARPAR